MILQKIQADLEELYQISLHENVEHYLTNSQTTSKEILFLRQTEENLELGLYLSKDVLEILKERNPYEHLTKENLEAFLLAVEGISHFNYVVWRATHDQPVTQLELELQGEIDKYLMASMFFLKQKNKVQTQLFQKLFENFDLHPTLTSQEKNRYQKANRLAQKFCSYLEKNFIRRGQWKKLIQHVRQFYHFNHWEKLRILTP